MKLWSRLKGKYARTVSRVRGRRNCMLRLEQPIISFTFDDFPKSAFVNGGRVLEARDLAATYYASLGLIGGEAPAGRIFDRSDLASLVERGHELGCHTYDHYDAWKTSPKEFEESLLRNRHALGDLIPGAEFQSLSFPISCPHPNIKRKASARFSCCRGGGQTFNEGITDLNNLRAYFLEQCRGGLAEVQRLIDGNRQARGWLIFATHDVSANPTTLGCTTSFFSEVVENACVSGARILPVFAAWKVVARAGFHEKQRA